MKFKITTWFCLFPKDFSCTTECKTSSLTRILQSSPEEQENILASNRKVSIWLAGSALGLMWLINNLNNSSLHKSSLTPFLSASNRAISKTGNTLSCGHSNNFRIVNTASLLWPTLFSVITFRIVSISFSDTLLQESVSLLLNSCSLSETNKRNYNLDNSHSLIYLFWIPQLPIMADVLACSNFK